MVENYLYFFKKLTPIKLTPNAKRGAFSINFSTLLTPSYSISDSGTTFIC